ncbi:MAG TPA: class II aldolase/adducin family protein [Longimicrobiales bacterium]|nr:class II aldolase/adducin family protein [Longimicrobiales bacterium]
MDGERTSDHDDRAAILAAEDRMVAATDHIVAAGRRFVAAGLGTGSSGNIGVRAGGAILVTPTGVPWDALTAADMVAIDFHGEPAGGAGGHTTGRPSSEWRLHAAVLAARPDVAAVVHAHPTYATALACLRRPIPPFHYLVALAGGHEIPCTGWAAPGSAELAELAAESLQNCDACLLANHGIVTIGADLDDALDLAVEVETLARQYCAALQMGEPVLLSEDQMAEMVSIMGRYRRDRTLRDENPDCHTPAP